MPKLSSREVEEYNRQWHAEQRLAAARHAARCRRIRDAAARYYAATGEAPDVDLEMFLCHHARVPWPAVAEAFGESPSSIGALCRAGVVAKKLERRHAMVCIAVLLDTHGDDDLAEFQAVTLELYEDISKRHYAKLARKAERQALADASHAEFLAARRTARAGGQHVHA